MGAPRSLALCHYYLGATDYLRGRFRDALQHLTEANSLFRQIDAAAGEAVACQYLGMTKSALGALDEGRAYLEQGIVVARRGTMWSHTLIRLYAALARNRLDANDAVGARAAAEAGLALVDVHGRCICNAAIYCVATAALALTGDHERARALGDEAIARAHDLGSPLFQCLAYQSNAMVYLLSGEWNAAFEALDQARHHAESIKLSYEVGRILLMRAFIHVQRHHPKDYPAAAALTAEALPIFIRLGARASAAQARSSLRFIRDQSTR